MSAERTSVYEKTYTLDELTGPISDKPEGHWVRESQWPIALCGYRVTAKWGDENPASPICGECARIRRSLGI